MKIPTEILGTPGNMEILDALVAPEILRGSSNSTVAAIPAEPDSPEESQGHCKKLREMSHSASGL